MTGDGRIRNRRLNDELPAGGPLRTYLVGKEETAVVRPAGRPPDHRAYRAAYGRIPRTLLVMPPMRLFEGAVKRVVPPLGLCYVAAACEQDGIDVDVLDCIVEGVDEEEELVAPGVWRFGMSDARFREFVAAGDYDVVGLSMIYSSDLENLYRCAEIVKQVKRDTIVVAGGIHATIYAEQFLRDGVRDGTPIVDFVIRGEGETRLSPFLRGLAEGAVDVAADGLAGWMEGELFCNPQVSRIRDLDRLPFPAYHKVPMERYFEHNVPFSPYPRGHRVMQLYTSRGCPISCTFCASTNFQKAYIARSVQGVVDEIAFYQRKYGIDEIQFADDNLTFDRKRAFALFEAMKPLGLPWCTPNGIMINTLDGPLLDGMIDSGLYQITLSLDSGNARTLKERHHKPVDLTRVPDLMDFLSERGILMHGTLVVGMPGETEEDILEGFDYVERLPFHSLNIFIAQAIPGSELFEKSVLDGSITYERSLHIDTARSTLALSSIAPERLEGLVEQFLERFNRVMYQRDPQAWERKYRDHRERMARICVGNASANTATILTATQPA